MKRTTATNLARHAAPLLLVLVASTAGAQLREGQSPVLEPPKRTAPAPIPDIAPDFAQAYERAGHPRILLYWNQALSETIAAPMATSEVVKQSSAGSRNAMEKSTAGPAGSVKLDESDSKDDSTRTTTRTSGYIDQHRRQLTISERNAATLEQTFVGEMRRGGVRFVDKALAVRMTAAKAHRNDSDPRRVETDALLAHADLLMEVVFVGDKDAPMGYAFDVRVKDVRGGTQIASTITRAIPPPPPLAAARWNAGENGYERRPPPAPPKPGVVDVGRMLAREVMTALQDELSHATATRHAR